MKTIIAVIIIGLCLSASVPMGALAQGFPGTLILDDFNRANEGPPPSANWVYPLIPADGGLEIIGNELGSTVQTASSYWNTLVGPDCEVYVVVHVPPSTANSEPYVELYARATDAGATIDGYAVQWYYDGENWRLILIRYDDGAGTTLDMTVMALDADREIGMSLIGPEITVYVDGWQQLSFTDATYGDAGYIGVRLANQDVDQGARLDNFGGGSEVAPAAPFRLFLPILFRQVTAWPSTAASRPDRRR
jgi:hypothetical protein